MSAGPSRRCTTSRDRSSEEAAWRARETGAGQDEKPGSKAPGSSRRVRDERLGFVRCRAGRSRAEAPRGPQAQCDLLRRIGRRLTSGGARRSLRRMLRAGVRARSRSNRVAGTFALRAHEIPGQVSWDASRAQLVWQFEPTRLVLPRRFHGHRRLAPEAQSMVRDSLATRAERVFGEDEPGFRQGLVGPARLLWRIGEQDRRRNKAAIRVE